MSPEETESLIAHLESSAQNSKGVFVRRVAEKLGLECRFLARDEDHHELQNVQLRGYAEVSVRLLDQMRDYELGHGHGRPDRDFIEMLTDYGDSYSLQEQIDNSLKSAMKELYAAGPVN